MRDFLRSASLNQVQVEYHYEIEEIEGEFCIFAKAELENLVDNAYGFDDFVANIWDIQLRLPSGTVVNLDNMEEDSPAYQNLEREARELLMDKYRAWREEEAGK